MRKLIVLLVIASQTVSNDVYSQKKVVIMGSSTAWGSDASPGQAWAQKITAHFRKNLSDGQDTVFYNIAEFGYNTYHEMPTGYTPPVNRPNPDPDHNVTKALSYSPDIVIINLPNNDVANLSNYNKKETMDNFRTMNALITASGAKCFFATPQPRNDLGTTSRQWLRDLVDSVNLNFGAFAINFWDDLVATDNYAKPEVLAGISLYHLNDVGHNYLFLRVRDKDIFNVTAVVVPVKLKDFKASIRNSKVEITWNVELEETTTSYQVERSQNGIDFSTIYSLNGKASKAPVNYLWTDEQPLAGKSFYRLKITENNSARYSRVISVVNSGQWAVKKVYSSNHQQLVAELNVSESQVLQVNVHNYSGSLVQKQSVPVSSSNQKITIPIENLSSGQYLLTIMGNGNQYSQAFFK